MSEHRKIVDLFNDIMPVDTDDLLPQHYPLLDQDFKTMGRCSTTGRKIWLESTRAALAAA